jgi:hypothetical protein
MYNVLEEEYTFLSYVAEFFLEWEMFQTKVSCRKNQNGRYMFNNFLKIVPFMR